LHWKCSAKIAKLKGWFLNFFPCWKHNIMLIYWVVKDSFQRIVFIVKNSQPDYLFLKCFVGHAIWKYICFVHDSTAVFAESSFLFQKQFLIYNLLFVRLYFCLASISCVWTYTSQMKTYFHQCVWNFNRWLDHRRSAVPLGISWACPDCQGSALTKIHPGKIHQWLLQYQNKYRLQVYWYFNWLKTNLFWEKDSVPQNNNSMVRFKEVIESLILWFCTDLEWTAKSSKYNLVFLHEWIRKLP